MMPPYAEVSANPMQQLPPVLYFIVMAIALAGWAMLIFFPRRPWANFWFSGVAVPMVLCLIQLFVLCAFWFQDPRSSIGNLLTLEGVLRTFGNYGLLLVAWINILSMDLVVGSWMARKAAQVRMPYIYLLPCLVVTFVFAGFGFTMFCVAMAFGERWSAIVVAEEAPPVKKVAFPVLPAGVTQ
jgi:hypothetical protein